MHQKRAWTRTETVPASVFDWSLPAFQVASAFLSFVATADNCAPSSGPGDANRALRGLQDFAPTELTQEVYSRDTRNKNASDESAN